VKEPDNSAAVVKQLIAQVLGLSEVDLEMSIHNTIEWDSLSHLKMLDVLESHFDCLMELDEISEVQSVGDWVELIHKYTS